MSSRFARHWSFACAHAKVSTRRALNAPTCVRVGQDAGPSQLERPLRDLGLAFEHLRAVIEAATDAPAPALAPAPSEQLGESGSAAAARCGFLGGSRAVSLPAAAAPDAELTAALAAVLGEEEGWRKRATESQAEAGASVARCGTAVTAELDRLGRFVGGGPDAGDARGGGALERAEAFRRVVAEMRSAVQGASDTESISLERFPAGALQRGAVAVAHLLSSRAAACRRVLALLQRLAPVRAVMHRLFACSL